MVPCDVTLEVNSYDESSDFLEERPAASLHECVLWEISGAFCVDTKPRRI